MLSRAEVTGKLLPEIPHRHREDSSSDSQPTTTDIFAGRVHVVDRVVGRASPCPGGAKAPPGHRLLGCPACPTHFSVGEK